MDIKGEILTILKNINREGMDKVITLLERSDYFTSPASTKRHLSVKGGLALHSYIVYKVLKDYNDLYTLKLNSESIAIIALLHDICKIECYTDNILKNGTRGATPYKYHDEFPIGHGEKSVILLQSLGLKLTQEEMMAIRFHIGPFTFGTLDAWKMATNSIRDAGYNKIVMVTYLADMTASQLLEEDGLYEKYILQNRNL